MEAKSCTRWNAWQELCAHTTVRTIKARQAVKPIIVVSSDATAGTCMQTLADNNILSAPVVRGREVLGFIDVIDLVGAGVRAFSSGDIKEDLPADVWTARLARLPSDEALSRSAKFFSTPVTELMST